MSASDAVSIDVVCAACRRLVRVPGVPYDGATVLRAAAGLGWFVGGRRAYCSAVCAAKGVG